MIYYIGAFLAGILIGSLASAIAIGLLQDSSGRDTEELRQFFIEGCWGEEEGD